MCHVTDGPAAAQANQCWHNRNTHAQMLIRLSPLIVHLALQAAAHHCDNVRSTLNPEQQKHTRTKCYSRATYLCIWPCRL
jgi:hypothetical protein